MHEPYGPKVGHSQTPLLAIRGSRTDAVVNPTVARTIASVDLMFNVLTQGREIVQIVAMGSEKETWRICRPTVQVLDSRS